MAKNLLLLGGSHSELPLIHAAQGLGFRVITTGNDPLGYGHKFADEYVFGDFSDIAAMTDLAKSLNVDAICAGCNDFAAISAAAIAEELGLPGHDPLDFSRMIHQKSSFYSLASEAGFPVPNSFEISSLKAAHEVAISVGFPVIVKPIDLTGGKGISIAHSAEDLEKAWNHARQQTRADSTVIQKYITGTNHAISSLILNQQLLFSFIDNEHYFTNPHLVGAASFPSILSLELQALIKKSVSELILSYTFVDGLLHLQFIVDENEDYFFIDVCRRAPGDLYIQFVEEATGIKYPEMIVRCESGLPVVLQQPIIQKKIGRLCLMPRTTGRFHSVHDLPGPGVILSRLQVMSTGTIITDIDTQKIEIILMEFESDDEMKKVMNDPSVRFQISTT
jgi:biotin carboxylase